MLVGIIFSAVDGAAQSGKTIAPPDSIPSPAGESAWRALLEARKADESDFARLPSNANERAGALTRRAERHAITAGKAKDFFENYPDHPSAGEARCLEINSLLAVEADGGAGNPARLKKAVADLRSDPKASGEVKARGVSAFEYSRALQGTKSEAERRTAVKTTARMLVAEFPSEEPGYRALLAMARIAPAEETDALAREIVGSTAVPSEVKASAQILIERAALIGRPLAEVLGSAGTEVMAKISPNTAMIVYSWATWAPSSLELGAMIFDRQLPAMGICLDEDVAAAQSLHRIGGFGGVLIYDSAGRNGALAQALRFDVPGHVYVVDAAGVIRDVRGGESLESKLTKHGVKSTIPKPADAG